MTNPLDDVDTVAIINAKMAELGPEFGMGTDVQRQWASSIQALVNPEFSVVVFRDQNFYQAVSGNLEVSMKNVASMVVPTVVLMEFHKNLASILEAIAAQSAGVEVG